MILNTGLDAACTLDGFQGSGSGGNRSNTFFGKFLMYACFGTGSSAPDPTDTALDSQVGGREFNRGGFANVENAGIDTNNNIIWYEGTFTRVFSIGSNVNAAEWGLAPATTGNLSVRELFRSDPLDNNSNPITLTLEAGDELQLVITFRVQADWEYVSKSFEITGTAGNDTNGTHDGNATVTSGAASTLDDIVGALGAAWPGGGASGSGNTLLNVWFTDQASRGINQDLTGATTSFSQTANAYTPGSFYRDWSSTLGTSEAVGDHYAWSIGNSAGRGYRFILTSPTKLAKASTHKLTLTTRKSIARL